MSYREACCTILMLAFLPHCSSKDMFVCLFLLKACFTKKVFVQNSNHMDQWERLHINSKYLKMYHDTDFSKYESIVGILNVQCAALRNTVFHNKAVTIFPLPLREKTIILSSLLFFSTLCFYCFVLLKE